MLFRVLNRRRLLKSEMDDVEIADVNDDDSPVRVARDPLKNQDLSYLTLSVGDLLSQYGWHLLIVTFVVYLFIQHLKKRRSSQSNRSSDAQTPQDATLVARRQEAMEVARRKMQEELDAKAVIFREKQKQQEEEKRRQKIENYEGIVQLSETTEEATSSSTVLKPKSDKKPLRSPDYNPLTGQGGGTCSWRPGRRGPSSGG